MDRITLYHGSEKIIEKPRFGGGNNHGDYGNAFYCTRDLHAAKEWANKKGTSGFANKYAFDARGLSVLDLTDKSIYNVLNWFAILMHYRYLEPDFKDYYKRELDYLEKNYFIDVSKYDVVIGFRADDSYFEFPLMFIESQIRVERFEDIYQAGYLGEQVVIISQKAYERLSFVEATPSEPIYFEKYRSRISIANRRVKEIVKEERWLDGTRLMDLVKKDD